MAKRGFKVLDSDMHIMEPPDLWPRYIDPEFRDIAPRGMTSANVRDLRTYFPGREPETRRANISSGHSFELGQDIFRHHSERGWTADCQLEAMDIEGIDVAVLFPTRGLSVLTLPNIEPPFAAAIARAYNDWMFDFCRTDPARLLGAGMLSVLDVNDAIQEAERAVKELGFRAVFLRSNIVNGKTWHDPSYEPLWDTLERFDIPLGFHEATGSRSIGLHDLCDEDQRSPARPGRRRRRGHCLVHRQGDRHARKEAGGGPSATSSLRTPCCLSSCLAITGWMNPNSRKLRVRESSSASEILRGFARSARRSFKGTWTICGRLWSHSLPSCPPWVGGQTKRSSPSMGGRPHSDSRAAPSIRRGLSPSILTRWLPWVGRNLSRPLAAR